jgi:hypothetical protein
VSLKILGLDWFDLLVHLSFTVVGGIAAEAIFVGDAENVAIISVLATSLAILGWRRKRALAGRTGTTGSTAVPEAARLAELEERMDQMEQLGQRVLELEERLDFAERLLVRQREQDPARLEPGA